MVVLLVPNQEALEVNKFCSKCKGPDLISSLETSVNVVQSFRQPPSVLS